MPNPEFECPITSTTMTDAAVTECGHRFESSAILFWIDECKAKHLPETCPCCRATIQKNTLIRDTHFQRRIDSDPEVISERAAKKQVQAATQSVKMTPPPAAPSSSSRIRASTTDNSNEDETQTYPSHDLIRRAREFNYDLHLARRLYAEADIRLIRAYQDLLYATHVQSRVTSKQTMRILNKNLDDSLAIWLLSHKRNLIIHEADHLKNKYENILKLISRPRLRLIAY